MPWSLFAESILFASSRTQLVAATQCELGLPIDESLDAVSGGRGSNTYLVPGERFHTTYGPLYLLTLALFVSPGCQYVRLTGNSVKIIVQITTLDPAPLLVTPGWPCPWLEPKLRSQ